MKNQHAKIRRINSSRKEVKSFIISSLLRNMKKHIIMIAKIICPASALLSPVKSGSKTSRERRKRHQRRLRKRENRTVSAVKTV
jgi:hypothetical protein